MPAAAAELAVRVPKNKGTGELTGEPDTRTHGLGTGPTQEPRPEDLSKIPSLPSPSQRLDRILSLHVPTEEEPDGSSQVLSK